MDDKMYLQRLVDHSIKQLLLTNGCVLIEGTKWVGKKTTAEKFSKSVLKLQKPATFRQYKILSDIGDEKLFYGEKLINEGVNNLIKLSEMID